MTKSACVAEISYRLKKKKVHLQLHLMVNGPGLTMFKFRIPFNLFKSLTKLTLMDSIGSYSFLFHELLY